MTLQEYYFKFPTKAKCLDYLEKLRWNNEPKCPYCLSEKYTESKSKRRYHCNTCNTTYSVTVNSLFHKTRVDFQKWFYTIQTVTKTNPTISTRELSEEISTAKDTSWRMIKEIKNALIKQDELIFKIIENGK